MSLFAILLVAGIAGQADAADKKDADPADPTVCRREAPVGSRVLGRRICKKRSQWTAQSKSVSQDGRVVPQWQGGSGYSPRAN